MSLPLEGTFIKSRYEIQRHIATGGMAAVFLGWDHRIERPVAIKVLRQLDEASDQDLARFRREARAAALLDDPHVVQVYDFFEENGCCFLVMEYVAGTNLKRYLRESGPLAPDDAFALGEQVCAALEAAHGWGFIHRDIKPQNVLLDDHGLAKLTDFGIVHLMRERMTTSGAVLGTADYIAPEQARGEPLTPGADLYAVGVMLYEMLTGRLLFTGRTPLAVATQHATAPVVPPSRYVAGLSPYIEAVVLRALQKRPERRYQTAARMRLALRLAREAVAREGDPDTATGGRGARAIRVVREDAPRRREERAGSIAVLAEAETQIAALKGRRTDDSADAAQTIHGPARPPVIRVRGRLARTPVVGDREHTDERFGVAELDAVADPAQTVVARAVAIDDADDNAGAMAGERIAAAESAPLDGDPLDGDPQGHAAEIATLRWSRLGVTALVAMGLVALLLVLGLWPHAHVILSSLLP